jgi:hypothetical protein
LRRLELYVSIIWQARPRQVTELMVPQPLADTERKAIHDLALDVRDLLARAL